MAETPLKSTGTYRGRLTNVVVGAAAMLAAAGSVPARAQAVPVLTPECAGKQIVLLDQARGVFDQFRKDVAVSHADSPIAKMAAGFVNGYDGQIATIMKSFQANRISSNPEQPFSSPNRAFNAAVNDTATVPHSQIGDGPEAQGLPRIVQGISPYGDGDMTASQATATATKLNASMTAKLALSAASCMK